MNQRLIISWIAIALLSACVDVNAQMRSWEGHRISDVIAQWGPPAQIIDDGTDKIYVWAKTRSYTSPGHAETTTNVAANNYGNPYYANATANSRTTYTPPETTTWQASRMFWVNEYGVIYKWSWRGY